MCWMISVLRSVGSFVKSRVVVCGAIVVAVVMEELEALGSGDSGSGVAGSGVAGGVAIVSPAMQSDRCRWGRLDKLRLAALKGQTGKHVRQHVYNGLSLTLCACRPTSNHETWGGRAAPH